MCGICGLLDTGGRGARQRLSAMCTAMHHRGPDDEGCLVDRSVGLAMRRLSIIDVAGGRQPMYNEDGTIAIVHNGEIYNYRELTSELKNRGHHFTTQSDTETIVHAYEEWGADCVHRLRGMFAFAIVDSREGMKEKREKGWPSGQAEPSLFDFSTLRQAQDTAFFPFPFPTLFLARDRLGIKPLYYYQDNDVFVFASEVRALLASGLVPRRLSLDGLASYLAYGSVQEPLTLIDGVYSLSPGHCMEWKMENGEWKGKVERHWEIPKPAEGEGKKGKREKVVGEIREILREAVRLRLVSEVPLGAFLSSGIDSSAIVALMSQVSDAPVQTFTIGFNEEAFNEATVARATANHLGTVHHEILVTPQEVLTDLPQALAAMDQPTMDGINTYYVSRATKRAGITVALSGLGGDEIFAGYPTFRTVPRLMKIANYLPTNPNGRFRFPSSLFHLPLSIFQNDRWRKLGAFLTGQTYFNHPYYISRALFTSQQRAQLLTRDMPDPGESNAPWQQYVADLIEHASGYDTINAISFLECTNYMTSTLLRDTDCMSMAHSLEVRVPLIDHVLVEHMMQLPGSIKLNRGTPKRLLVQALDRSLLPEVIHQKKRTFTFPWSHWLRNELRSEVEETLTISSSALQGILEPAAVANVWQQFLAGRTSWSRVWALYVLQQWVERHLG